MGYGAWYGYLYALLEQKYPYHSQESPSKDESVAQLCSSSGTDTLSAHASRKNTASVAWRRKLRSRLAWFQDGVGIVIMIIIVRLSFVRSGAACASEDRDRAQAGGDY
jgi:hypothetical protein